MTRLTLKAVNAALAAAGAKEVLVQGKGYLYFAEGDADCWREVSVGVPRLNHLSLEQWIAAWRRLKAQHDEGSVVFRPTRF
jgi:hypothetical protein